MGEMPTSPPSMRCILVSDQPKSLATSHWRLAVVREPLTHTRKRCPPVLGLAVRLRRQFRCGRLPVLAPGSYSPVSPTGGPRVGIYSNGV